MTPKNWLSIVALMLCVLLQSNAEIPSAEKLLPEDTLLMLTAPEFARIREIVEASPQMQLWNDPAIKPFKEKFLTRWTEDFLIPLERELKLHFDDFTSLLQGQVTFAITQNSSGNNEDPATSRVLLIDTRGKGGQLRTNLAGLRAKWLDSGAPVQDEKIRNIEFSVLPVSSNDVPRTLRRFLPSAPQVQELGSEGESKKPPTRTELVVGQVDSLFIVADSIKLVEKIVARLGGSSMPSLGELAAYDANHQALFREAPFYGWINMKGLAGLITRNAVASSEPDASAGFGPVSTEKLLTASGLASVKTIAFSFRNSSEGSLFEVFFAVPEASRQGLFRLLGNEPKDSTPPEFVPAEAVKFRRWRLDGRKTWTTLQKIMSEISPQWIGGVNFLIDAASATAKEKDPAFDVKQALIGNLGDDLISYQRAPEDSSLAALRSPPSLLLIGSPKPDQLAIALKTILSFLNQQGGRPVEREFLGRKIYTLPAPNLPLPMTTSARPALPRLLNFAASNGYVAISTEASMLEEFLRSTESQRRSLREMPGLSEAMQKVVGPGTILFGFQNEAETKRLQLELLKKDPASLTNSSTISLSAILGVPDPKTVFADFMDFSLLPGFGRMAKYFDITVYGGSASVQGLTLKFFAPSPPRLR